MTKTKEIQTIVVAAKRHTRELIKRYLNEFGSLNFLAAADDYLKVYSALKDLKEALVIIDISEHTDGALDFISLITSDFPGCRVIAMSEKPDVDLVIQVMRMGEFVSLPLIKNEFFTSLSKSYEELTQKNKKKSKCRIVTVFSNKGGVGKTSAAVNLALELAKAAKEKVALVDLNFQLGDVTTFMDLKPSFNISYMLKNPDRINEEFLLSAMERYKDTSLYILADPPYFKQAEDISPKQISLLFNVLKDTFSYVVVDTSAGFDTKAAAVLENSDMTLLLSIVNLPALRNCQRCLDLFDNLGYSNVQVVINRYMENDEISAADVEELLNKNIYWKIPNNYFAMMSSINKGIPVSDVSPDSNVAQSYRDLALLVSDSIHRPGLAEKYKEALGAG
ncbi:MAG: AAA family ATPase [Heliobacteriaceae bacterium]|jgi:pilus assembly protein CpaE|nr:AAA family ATPase [Heliobacteriaceae bacterium]